MKKPDFEKIYLVPEDGDYVWDATPAPGAYHDQADAVEYVRADLHQLAIVERDQAWQELREIREAIGANPEESTADEVRRVVAQRDISTGAWLKDSNVNGGKRNGGE